MAKLTKEQTNKSLRFSFWDGIFASGMTGFTQEYFTPFILLLGATTKHVGLLSAFPNLLAALVQLKSADIAERIKSRRKIINTFAFLQALMFLPLIGIALSGNISPNIFIIVITLFASFGAFFAPIWGSLMSDLVSEDKRGEYFGWRNRLLGYIVVGTTFIAGFVLHVMKNINIFYGFMFLFGFAFIFRMLSWHFLRKMDEPLLTYHKENYFNLYDFFARIKESNFAKFVLFVAMLSFSVNLAAPFFAVFMLRELKFSYFTYTVITVVATLVIFSTMGRWGRHADKVGNLKIIKFTAPLTGIMPLCWILNQHPVFLFFVQIFSGFIWAGFNLCAGNFIFDAVTPEKRIRCISYFNVLNGLAVCAGAVLGGFLVNKLPPVFGYQILTLFLISAVLRLLVGFFMPVNLKEVRGVEKIKKSRLFFSMVGIKPILGIEGKAVRF